MLGLSGEEADNPRSVCHHRDVCPWCWARRVAQIHWVALAARGPESGGRYPTRVLSLLCSGVVGFHSDLRGWLRWLTFQLRAIAGANPLVGGYLAVLACPAVQGKEEVGWRLEGRVLGLMPANRPLEIVPPGAGDPGSSASWRLYGGPGGEEPTDEALETHIIRVCRYPMAMMSATPARVVQVFTARHDVRLTELLGKFRARKHAGGPACGVEEAVASVQAVE